MRFLWKSYGWYGSIGSSRFRQPKLNTAPICWIGITARLGLNLSRTFPWSFKMQFIFYVLNCRISGFGTQESQAGAEGVW